MQFISVLTVLLGIALLGFGVLTAAGRRSIFIPPLGTPTRVSGRTTPTGLRKAR